MRTLAAGGADVVLCSSTRCPPRTTWPHPWWSITRSRCSPPGEDRDTYYRHIGQALDHRPHVTMDDGADLVSELHTPADQLLPEVVGGTEETTTGVIRLRAMAADGALVSRCSA